MKSFLGGDSRQNVERRAMLWSVVAVVASTLLVASQATAAVTNTSVKTGEWTTNSTWYYSPYPVAGDTARITSGFEVTLGGSNSAAAASVFTSYQGGTAGTFTIDTSGTFTTNTIYAGNYASGGIGTLNIKNGTATINTGLFVGGAGTGVVNQSGGTVRISGTYGLSLADSATTGTGTYNLSAGTLEGASAGAALAKITLGVLTTTSGTSLFDQTGGTVRATTVSFAAASGKTATYELDGGDLWLNSMSGNVGTPRGTYSFVWGGGTLHPYNANMTFTNATTIPITLNAGATPNTLNTLDTNGAARDVALTPAISGGGGLTIAGGGTVTMSAANSYTGSTTIGAGTLAVTGSLANNGSDKVFIAANTVDSTTFGATLTRAVGSGTNKYAGFGSAINGDLNSTADILAGDSTGSHTLSMRWRERNVADMAQLLASDVLNLSGMSNGGSTDTFVLQMKYDPNELSGGLANESALAAGGAIHLAWLDSSTWKNAILGNVGANSGATNVQGSWADAGGGTMALGAWGVDIANDVVWAVVNHNSEFAVVPEPGTLVLFGAGLLGLVAYAWRKRK